MPNSLELFKYYSVNQTGRLSGKRTLLPGTPFMHANAQLTSFTCTQFSISFQGDGATKGGLGAGSLPTSINPVKIIVHRLPGQPDLEKSSSRLFSRRF